jgi:hypothetical protein
VAEVESSENEFKLNLAMAIRQREHVGSERVCPTLLEVLNAFREALNEETKLIAKKSRSNSAKPSSI